MREPETQPTRTPGHGPTPAWTVECAGDARRVPHDRALLVGRAGDLAIDDNPHLHRRLLEVVAAGDVAWLANVGGRIPVAVSDDAGLVRATLAPGGRLAVPAAGSRVTFAAGSTRYEILIWAESADDAAADGVAPPGVPHSALSSALEVLAPDVWDLEDTLVGAPLTPAQKLLLVALAEPVLRGDEAVHAVPTTTAAAARLGWTPRAFTRRLDHVCRKLARAGAPGVAATDGRAATHRRLRLVEYAVATRIVTPDDLALLPTSPR